MELSFALKLLEISSKLTTIKQVSEKQADILDQINEISSKIDEETHNHAHIAFQHVRDGVLSSVEDIRRDNFRSAQQYFTKLIKLGSSDAIDNSSGEASSQYLTAVGYWGNFLCYTFLGDMPLAAIQVYECISQCLRWQDYPTISKVFLAEIIEIHFSQNYIKEIETAKERLAFTKVNLGKAKKAAPFKRIKILGGIGLSGATRALKSAAIATQDTTTTELLLGRWYCETFARKPAQSAESKTKSRSRSEASNSDLLLEATVEKASVEVHPPRTIFEVSTVTSEAFGLLKDKLTLPDIAENEQLATRLESEIAVLQSDFEAECKERLSYLIGPNQHKLDMLVSPFVKSIEQVIETDSEVLSSSSKAFIEKEKDSLTEAIQLGDIGLVSQRLIAIRNFLPSLGEQTDFVGNLSELVEKSNGLVDSSKTLVENSKSLIDSSKELLDVLGLFQEN